MKSQMRMLSVHHRHLCALLGNAEKEQACFLLCAVAQGDDEVILLVREVVSLTPQDFVVQRYDQLSVSSAALLRVVRKAQALNHAICMVHTHPMSRGAVEFSYADDIGNERTFDFLHRMLPGLPHCCLVWDGMLECCAGRLYEDGHIWEAMDQVSIVNDKNLRILRDTVRTLTFNDVPEEFERQARLLGPDGQAALGERRIAIVGCGGIGSVMGSVLVHSGVRNFLLIDHDVIGRSNLSRLLSSMPGDVEEKKFKIDILKRYIKSCAPAANVFGCEKVVEDKGVLRKLVSSDLIVCCTDDTTSRAYLNQVGQQYYLPVVDLGVQFAVNPSSGVLVKEVGKVNLVLPGLACMICSQHIHPKNLHDESLSDGELRKRANYIEGLDEEEPSMMAFNMQVAGRAAQLITCWTTGLMPVDLETYERFSFLGVAGKKGIHSVVKRADPDCPMCGSHSRVLGAGDSESMWVRPRPRKVA